MTLSRGAPRTGRVLKASPSLRHKQQAGGRCCPEPAAGRPLQVWQGRDLRWDGVLGPLTAVTCVLEEGGRRTRGTEEEGEAAGRQADVGVMGPQAQGRLEPQELEVGGRASLQASEGAQPR